IVVFDGPMAAAESAGDAVAGAAPTAPEASRAHSTTNVQEIGVDEPDVIKTDGRLIVTVVGPTLRVIDTSGGSPDEVGRLPLGRGDYPDASVLLAGDRAVVLVRDNPMIAYDAPTSPDVQSGPGAAIAPSYPYQPSTTVLLVDLSDPSDPRVESSLEVDGMYLDARLVDDTVRLVVSSQPRLSFPMTEADWNRSEKELTARNQSIVAASNISDWLPSYRLDVNGEQSSGQLVTCDRLSHPEEFAGFTTVSVLTFDLADGLSDGDAVGVLADGDTVYASTDRLYVATTRWGAVVPMADSRVAPPIDDERTGIHAFDIAGDDPANYVASGEVDGRIIGRYAMSEHDGVLRVATTVTGLASGEQSESSLFTLAERGDELVEVGAVGGLGKGEQIFAVRYFGDTGYVVTFRQTDPLYVLDLSDPAAPEVSGELKITGYSAYLHGVGEGRLVGVGQEATAEGQAIGSQVSLFDVSDPSSPAKLDGHVLRNAWSQAEADPHAFLYWPGTAQLVVPIDGATDRGALVLGVGEDSLTDQGMVTHAGADVPEQWSTVLRSLVIGDSLYTLWTDGLQVNDLDDLDVQGWLPLA
ncbi:MAG: beta-propeller domain-containing protein, partial [Jiangellaceae bacterium]